MCQYITFVCTCFLQTQCKYNPHLPVATVVASEFVQTSWWHQLGIRVHLKPLQNPQSGSKPQTVKNTNINHGHQCEDGLSFDLTLELKTVGVTLCFCIFCCKFTVVMTGVHIKQSKSLKLYVYWRNYTKKSCVSACSVHCLCHDKQLGFPRLRIILDQCVCCDQ